MALDYPTITQQLAERFGDSVTDFREEYGMLSFEVAASRNTEVIQFLRDNLGFNFLTDLCGVHYPDNTAERQFAVVYHLHNWVENVRLRFKCFLPGDKPEINTVTTLFLSANWQERETYDFYGIIFTGHPDLRRILNMDEMESFPLRKEFPLEDANRTDKDDRYFGREPQNSEYLQLK
ncbi:MAG: NADH-quinone oxidoreductase subunit C [Chitinophagales bacterium]|nr:NADH-quinone oxidoreductase subunit C [Chitinophagales bacterium]